MRPATAPGMESSVPGVTFAAAFGLAVELVEAVVDVVVVAAVPVGLLVEC